MTYDKLDVGFWKGKDGETSNKGNNSRSAKLTETDVVRIKERLLAGDRHIDIAKDYKVVPNTISDIARGRRWKSVKL